MESKTLDELRKGFDNFKRKHIDANNTIEKLVKDGQKPKVLFIACSDSRVDPALLTDCEPGDIFVVRNVANLVPAYNKDNRHHSTCAAIEYAVKVLGVKDIIICGHSSCGGINALVQGKTPFEFIDGWVETAGPAREKAISEVPNGTIEQQAKACEKISVELSIENLKTFPFIKEKVDENTLQLHAWYFNMDLGELELL